MDITMILFVRNTNQNIRPYTRIKKKKYSNWYRTRINKVVKINALDELYFLV